MLSTAVLFHLLARARRCTGARNRRSVVSLCVLRHATCAGAKVHAVGVILGIGLLLAGAGCSGPPGAEKAGDASSGDVALVFVGDVMLSRNVAKSIDAAGRDFSFLFEGVASHIRGADIAFCNLECPLSERGETEKKKNAFRAPTASAAGLVSAGFDIVSLGNNHSLDFGDLAAADTQATLDEAGVKYVGISEGDAPQAPVIMEAGGLKFGFLAYCTPRWKSYLFKGYSQRVHFADKEILERDIGAVRDQVDILVVSMHWGLENETEPNEIQLDLGRFMIEQGVDIVAGHHPHVLQAPAFYKSGLILYSMGNFVFDQRGEIHRQSCIYRVFVQEGGVSGAEFLPVEILKGTWQPMPQSDSFVALTPYA